MPLNGDLLSALAAPLRGRSRRISSNEQPNWRDGNFDMTRLAPGEVFELPRLAGPGVITHIWCTSHAGGVNELDAISLRIYWDDRPEPSVEAPLSAFFAVGQGRPAAVESLPVQVSPTGSLTCFWRMPFAESARIAVTNDNPHRASGLYWQVDWLELDSVPADTPYFHAQYSHEHPARSGDDYLIAEIDGRGHYVGTVLEVTLAQDGWFGEGDDFFYIDGEPVPSLQGTGTEDYFNDAWGFRQRTGPWSGQPRWQGDEAGDSGVCYRWHVLDPIRFERSLRFTIEHKGNRADPEEAWYIERADFYTSVAFWYQTGVAKRFGRLPPWPARRVPWTDAHLVPLLRSAAVTGGPAPSVETAGFFGGRPVLAWRGAPSGAALLLPIDVAQDGRYAARLTALADQDGGEFEVSLDDGEPVSLNLRSERPGEVDARLGVYELLAGEHVLQFRSLTEASGQGVLFAEMLRLLRLPEEVRRDVRTHNEAHFVRLAIGRATFAFRLAYERIPDSLEELAGSGLLPARNLQDENGHMLRSHRDGETLVVESSAPGGWTHRFHGLDARR